MQTHELRCPITTGPQELLGKAGGVGEAEVCLVCSWCSRKLSKMSEMPIRIIHHFNLNGEVTDSHRESR